MPERLRLLQPARRFSMPFYTARVGHWSDGVFEQVAREVSIDTEADAERLREVVKRVAAEIEILAGRRFGVSEQKSLTFLAQIFPFADVPDLQVGSPHVWDDGLGWPIPDPMNPDLATVVQLKRLRVPSSERPVPVVNALRAAGTVVARARRAGLLSAEYLASWLGNVIPRSYRTELLRALVDPAVRFNIPIAGLAVPGWWIQITRRLLWVTAETPDEGRLLEILFVPDTPDERPPMVLAAAEPVLIVARTMEHPATWAFSARIWTEEVEVAANRPWRPMAGAIHRHGVPTIRMDEAATDDEVACQLILVACWHRYISADEAGVTDAVIRAYPGPTQRIFSKTNQPDLAAAATLLLHRLLRPGFDPARSAAAARRYVSRLATGVVLEHRKATAADGSLPWQRLGISERYYYKLLRRHRVPKISGRYQVDSGVLDALRAYLDQRERPLPRRLAMELLIDRGFSKAAARKWLQRHPLEASLEAWPRRGGPLPGKQGVSVAASENGDAD
jgi:hypothetical protein